MSLAKRKYPKKKENLSEYPNYRQYAFRASEDEVEFIKNEVEKLYNRFNKARKSNSSIRAVKASNIALKALKIGLKALQKQSKWKWEES